MPQFSGLAIFVPTTTDIQALPLLRMRARGNNEEDRPRSAWIGTFACKNVLHLRTFTSIRKILCETFCTIERLRARTFCTFERLRPSAKILCETFCTIERLRERTFCTFERLLQSICKIYITLRNVLRNRTFACSKYNNIRTRYSLTPTNLGTFAHAHTCPSQVTRALCLKVRWKRHLMPSSIYLH